MSAWREMYGLVRTINARLKSPCARTAGSAGTASKCFSNPVRVVGAETGRCAGQQSLPMVPHGHLMVFNRSEDLRLNRFIEDPMKTISSQSRRLSVLVRLTHIVRASQAHCILQQAFATRDGSHVRPMLSGFALHRLRQPSPEPRSAMKRAILHPSKRGGAGASMIRKGPGATSSRWPPGSLPARDSAEPGWTTSPPGPKPVSA